MSRYSLESERMLSGVLIKCRRPVQNISPTAIRTAHSAALAISVV